MADLKTCPICFATTSKTNVHSHYGVSSCKSCKAFFRRITHIDSSAKLKCMENDAHCDMQRRPKLKCKKCRYLQCLRVGLDPSRVLGVEERKRFTFPNKKKQQRVESIEENEDITGNHETDENEDITGDHETDENEIAMDTTSANENSNELVDDSQKVDERVTKDVDESDAWNWSDDISQNADRSEDRRLQTFQPFIKGEKWYFVYQECVMVQSKMVCILLSGVSYVRDFSKNFSHFSPPP